MKIFDLIEEDNFIDFKSFVSNNKKSLLLKDSDDWSVISLLAHYNMPEYIDFILPFMTKEDINLSTPMHPLFVALEDKDFKMIDSFIDKDNFDFNFIYKNNENIVHYLLHRDMPELALKIITNKKIDNLFSVSYDGKQLLNLAIKKGFNNIVEEITSQVIFPENFTKEMIFDSVNYKNQEGFEILYQHYNIDNIDELFNYALNANNLQALNYILNSGDIIPGKEQIVKLINIVSKNYKLETEDESAKDIINFLFEIKVNFNSFSNENGENIWILAIKNSNDYLFNKLINETNESLNFKDSNEYSPLFYAINSLNVTYVKKILERKGNPNHIDYLKNNSLIYAIGQEVWTPQDIKDKEEIVKDLLKYKADFTHKNQHGESALSLAIHKKEMNNVSQLLWKGASLTHNPVKFINSQDVFNLNHNGSFEQLAPIIEEKTIDNFIALKQLGFSLSQKNENNESFTMFFIKEGYLANFLAILNLLNKDEINEIDNNGDSLIMNAIKKKNDDFALKILFYFKDLDLNVVNENGENVYDLCANFGNCLKMETLINNDSNLTVKKIQQALPLILKYGDISKYWKEFILIDPTLINFKDIDKNNLFMICASNANFNNIDYLFKEGIKYNSKDINLQKQTFMDIVISLPEEHEEKVSKTLSYLKKSSNKKIS